MYDIVIRVPENEPVTGQLGNGIYIVGSGTDSHIQLDADGISPRHCQLTVEDGGIKVMDLGSNTCSMSAPHSRGFPAGRVPWSAHPA